MFAMSLKVRVVITDKCKEKGINYSSKERLSSLKNKLEEVGVNVPELLRLSQQSVMLSPEAHGTTDALVQSLVPEVIAEISR